MNETPVPAVVAESPWVTPGPGGDLYADERPILTILGGVFAIAELVVIGLAVTRHPSPTSASNLAVLLLPGALAALILGFVSVGPMAPPPTAVRVDSEGVSFRDRHGRIRRQLWSSPSLSIRVEEVVAEDPWKPRGSFRRYLIGGRGGGLIVVEERTTRLVLETAIGRGLSVGSRMRTPMRGTTITRHILRAQSRTPR